MKAKKLFAALAAGVMLVCSAGCSKKGESSGKFEYSSKDFLPFMVMVDGSKIDLTLSSADKQKAWRQFCKGNCFKQQYSACGKGRKDR